MIAIDTEELVYNLIQIGDDKAEGFILPDEKEVKPKDNVEVVDCGGEYSMVLKDGIMIGSSERYDAVDIFNLLNKMGHDCRYSLEELENEAEWEK